MVVAVALASLVCGCGYNAGFIHDASSGNQHQVRMDVSAERFSRTVSGSATMGSILCLIPVDSGLFKQAMDALHEEANLKTNETLRDIREDLDPAFYLFLYCTKKLTISADVYELTPVSGGAPSSPSPSPVAELPPSRPKPPRLTYAQLQEALTEIQKDRDRTNHHEIAVRALGAPHKTDSENELWYGGLPGKSDCFVLRLSSKGASVDEAPEEKCR
jgi:hypothetical protein